MAKSAQRESWISGAVFVTQDDNRSIRKGHLRVVEGRIAEIRASLPARAKNVFDAAGLTVFPGFVQTHLHLCQTMFRNQADDMELLDWLATRIWIFEAAHTPKTLRTSALLGIQELLSSGTTCILDMGTMRHTNAIFEAVRDSGIRASVGKCLMDHPKTCPDSLLESTDAAIAEALALYARWNGAENDRIRASYAPRFAVSCTDRLLSEVARISREQGALIHTHACENRKEIEFVRELTGKGNIEHLDSLGLMSERLVLAHCVWLTEEEKRRLKSTGTHVAHCPSSNLKLASGIAPIPELLQMGISVSLGADGAPCNNRLDALGEMRLAALVHKPGSGPKAIRAQEALDLATRNGARALGWWDQIGSIEIGKKADLTALDLRGILPTPHATDSDFISSALVYSAQPTQVRATWVDGKLLFDGKKVRTIDQRQLQKDYESAQNKVFGPLLKKTRARG